MRSSSASAPYYLATPLIWNATYGLTQGAINSRRMSSGQYADSSGEPLSSPRTRTRPYVNDGQTVQDQSVHANWIPPSRPWPADPSVTAQGAGGSPVGSGQRPSGISSDQWVPTSPVSADPAPDLVPQADPFGPPINSGRTYPLESQRTSPFNAPGSVQGMQSRRAGRSMPDGTPPSGPPPSVVADKAPPLAPPIKKRHARGRYLNRDAKFSSQAGSQSSPASAMPSPDAFLPPTPAKASAATAASGSSPLARGFIQLVNENYQGDIGRALADSDMRKYARAIGLIGDQSRPAAELNSQRTELIKQILADDSEDPSVRVSAVKMLLKRNTGSQTAATGVPGI